MVRHEVCVLLGLLAGDRKQRLCQLLAVNRSQRSAGIEMRRQCLPELTTTPFDWLT